MSPIGAEAPAFVPMVDDFFGSLQAITGFEQIADPRHYRPLPDDWEIGVADVVGSTEAIVAGRYKAVNTAGAAVISAVSNALGSLDFPFVFTGDGMAYAIDPGRAAVARVALAAAAAWVRRELTLDIRTGTVQIAAIRAAGRDVKVARFAPSPNIAYAMFSGGGLAWADAALKAGTLMAPIAAPGTSADLAGLSCRFSPVQARNGAIVSLIVVPVADRLGPAFDGLVREILALVAAESDSTRPIVDGSLRFRWPPAGLLTEARAATQDGTPLWRSVLRVAVHTLVAYAVLAVGRDVGGFSPRRYRRQLVENTDFRKYEDGLMMTLDCEPALVDRLEARLSAARVAGIADFGLHRQDSALITCIVPSPTRADHVHFVDGAAGGYALAARALKESRGSAPSRL